VTIASDISAHSSRGLACRRRDRRVMKQTSDLQAAAQGWRRRRRKREPVTLGEREPGWFLSLHISTDQYGGRSAQTKPSLSEQVRCAQRLWWGRVGSRQASSPATPRTCRSCLLDQPK